uniref:BZIP domain-containing protein n=1 Tax=Cannabis sativa TaxID=3483 RepID=A0A803NLG1_CANSA
MGSHMNFNGFGDAPLGESGSGGGSGKPIGNNNMLARQSSVYSLTFDEFQNTIGGGYGKDFGSMNMDELLKNIWTAEETQILSASRQGSITLPRTLSQMTVDEVWRDLFKDSDNGAKVGGGGSNGTTSVGEANMPQRQQTLGEMTLEEFLVRAGIPATLAFTPPMHLVSNAQLTSPATRETIVGVNEPAVSSALVQARGLQQGRGGINSMANVGAATGTVTVGTRSPANHISSNVVAKASAVDSPSVSPPVPYMFSRGGKCGPGLEKVIERRHRRMIKNRESAARSRARKQAYTLELEAEIAKLKEVNEELLKKQEEYMEMQKVQMLETMNGWGNKRQCLRRTLTGPW